jgi:hypothetical protein
VTLQITQDQLRFSWMAPAGGVIVAEGDRARR